jgi:hypothetical protein
MIEILERKSCANKRKGDALSSQRLSAISSRAYTSSAYAMQSDAETERVSHKR